MRYRRTLGDYIFDSLNYFLLLMLVFITLYPLYYIFIASLSSPIAIAKHGVMMLWPEDITFKYYKAVFENPMITIGYRNTIFLVVVGTTINMLLTVFAAYTLSRRWLMGRKIFMFIIVVTMFFGGGLIPSFLLVKSLGLYNTIWALIIPSAVSSWNIVMVRTYFMGLPASLEESAKMDGANDFHILFRIILPVSTPILAVMVLFYAVGHWNAWFAASIYIKDRNLHPLQLVLRSILINNSLRDMGNTGFSGSGNAREVSKGLKYATVIASTLPILFVYPFVQKYFVKGILIGSIKG